MSAPLSGKRVPPDIVTVSCPWCRERKLRYYLSQRPGYQVVCEICGAAGPYRETPPLALEAWLDVARLQPDEAQADQELAALAPHLDQVVAVVVARVLTLLKEAGDSHAH